ncbi:DUF3558 family protein [Cellulomonas phragmiteti]|uniref:DUF3558 domain-containing protein n=1 Tax=Cellulomonas phragmiteti TaxID=478780 RepID=A0ABQ4DPB7_9CELL|nr:DUF3558 family protein [Cellulomonas phragmiteti]GIG41194.1 hypothetical protein Cph01nite_29560 [Cellulomonas phragmiteti]
MPGTRRRAVPWTVVLVVAALAACSSEQPATVATTDPPAVTPAAVATTAAASVAPEPAGPLQPCELVTRAEAEALARTPLLDGIRAGGDDDATCTYPGPTDGPVAQVEVFVGPGAEKYLDVERALGHVLEEVPGIGDEAHQEPGAIFVRQGTTWAAVRLVRLDDKAQYVEPMRELARTLVTRL